MSLDPSSCSDNAFKIYSKENKKSIIKKEIDLSVQIDMKCLQNKISDKESKIRKYRYYAPICKNLLIYT